MRYLLPESFFRTNAYQLPFQQKIFDSIVGSSVLHHLDIDNALNEFIECCPNRSATCILFTGAICLTPQIMLQKNIPYLKKKLGDSPDETAFFKWRTALRQHGFADQDYPL